MTQATGSPVVFDVNRILIVFILFVSPMPLQSLNFILIQNLPITFLFFCAKMNRNQAHLVKGGRSTSRVLAPPGGSSSICLGGYGGAAEQFSQYGGRSSVGKQKSMPPSMPARTESRDRDVPGLEGHYQQQRRSGGEDRVDAGYYGGAGGSARR